MTRVSSASRPLAINRRCARRRGLSLLEVILAIAILGGAIAAIGELVRLGVRSASYAQQQTLAHLLCDTRMAEIASGAVAPESIGQTPCSEASEWIYSVEVAQGDQIGLLKVMVVVQQDPAQFPLPLSFQLYRFIPDPAYIEELEAAQEVVY